MTHSSARPWSDGPQAALRRLRGYLLGCVSVDTRSLATFRILLGLLVIADLLLRARNFGFYYTDGGVVPQSLAERGAAEHAFSVYYHVSEPESIAALFLLQGAFALALVVGYRTRAATVVSFLFVVSLDHHNPFVLSYADTLFRLLFFWAIFLPLGERWSVDALHATGPRRQTVAGVATALAMAQMVFMYFLNGVHKATSETWRSGDAAPLVFGIDEMTFLLGDFVRAFPTLVGYGGLVWFSMLLGSFLLILLHGRLRIAMVALFVLGHASFAVTVRIGAFAYVAIAGLTLFLQSGFWCDAGRVARRLGVDPAAVQRRVRTTVGVPLAAALPAVRLPSGMDRITRVLSTLTIWLVAGAMLLVVALALLNAGAVADDTYDQDEVNALVEQHTIGSHVYLVAESLGIRQPEWSVFAPQPRTTDRYYVFGGRTVDGNRVDVFNDRAFAWDRPGDQLQKQHDTYRMRFFMNSVRRGSVGGDLTASYGEHLCRTYAEAYDIDLSHISMFEVAERITFGTIDDPSDRETDRTHFYRHECGS